MTFRIRIGDPVLHRGGRFAGWVFQRTLRTGFRPVAMLYVSTSVDPRFGVIAAAQESAWRKLSLEEETTFRLTGELPLWGARP